MPWLKHRKYNKPSILNQLAYILAMTCEVVVVNKIHHSRQIYIKSEYED